MLGYSLNPWALPVCSKSMLKRVVLLVAVLRRNTSSWLLVSLGTRLLAELAEDDELPVVAGHGTDGVFVAGGGSGVSDAQEGRGVGPDVGDVNVVSAGIGDRDCVLQVGGGAPEGNKRSPCR